MNLTLNKLISKTQVSMKFRIRFSYKMNLTIKSIKLMMKVPTKVNRCQKLSSRQTFPSTKEIELHGTAKTAPTLSLMNARTAAQNAETKAKTIMVLCVLKTLSVTGTGGHLRMARS